MGIVQLIQRLAGNDVRNLGRDRLFFVMIFSVVGLSIFFRYALPWLDGVLAESGVLPNDRVEKRLADYYSVLIAYFVVFQGGLFGGVIFGFALVEEKEDRTIEAMLVTPVPFRQYMLYRIALSAVFAYATVAFQLWVIGLEPLPLERILVLALGSCLVGPLATFFYAVYAENKVQAFAVAKLVGLAGWIVVLGWFVAEPLQWLFGLFPPFLVSKAYWMALEGNGRWGMALALGIVLQLGMLYYLTRRFRVVAYR